MSSKKFVSRGRCTVFQTIDIGNSTQVSKGRSKELITIRNEALLSRFYFYNSATKVMYEEILNILSKEFFLSVVTVGELLSNNAETLREIRKRKPTITQLKGSYPQFNWQLKS